MNPREKTSLTKLVNEVRPRARDPDAKSSDLFSPSLFSLLPSWHHVGYKFPRHLWLVSPAGENVGFNTSHLWSPQLLLLAWKRYPSCTNVLNIIYVDAFVHWIIDSVYSFPHWHPICTTPYFPLALVRFVSRMMSHEEWIRCSACPSSPSGSPQVESLGRTG